jgi:hypothetical protein
MVVGAGVLATELTPSARWSATLAGTLRWIDNTHYFWGPLAAALGAWVGGRERRHGVGELLAVTPRPEWQRVQLSWTAVAVGVLAGLLGQASLAVAAGLPSVSYSGGRWLATLAVLVLGVLTFAAFGFAAGRTVPGRLVAPLVGLLVLLLAIAAGADRLLRRMWPVDNLSLGDVIQVRTEVLGLFALLWLSLTGTAVLLAVRRRRMLAVLPLALAVTVSQPLTRTALSQTDPWSIPDTAATRLVCTTDAGPQVCVQQVHAGLLDDVTPLAREQIAEAGRLVDWTSAREFVFGEPHPADALTLPALDSWGRAFRGGLADPEEYLSISVSNQSTTVCGTADPGAATDTQALTNVTDTVARALQTRSVEVTAAVPGADQLYRRLVADPLAARRWMQQYQAASASCDLPVLARLAGR